MAVGDFPEGATATHKDGRKIVFSDGEWRVLQGAGGSGGASGSKPAGVEQSKAAAFLRRALGSARQYQRLGLGPRSLSGKAFAESHPDLANTLPEFLGGNSADRQVADASQLEFIAATLRQDSGANLPPDEIATQQRIYFPQPGDTQAAIDAKAEARKRVIEGLRDAAGSAVTDDLKKEFPNFFPEARAAKGGDQQSGAVGVAPNGSGAPPAGPGTPPAGGPGGPGGGEVVFNDQAPAQVAEPLKLAPEQTAAMQALVQSGASAEAIAALAKTFGANITPENAQALQAFYSDPKNRNVAPTVNVDNTVKAVDPGDGSVGAFARGITSNVPFSREIAAGVETIADPTTTLSQNLDEEYGKRRFVEENNGTAYTLGAVAGSLPLGGVELAGAREAARAAGLAAVRAGTPVAEARALANRVFATRTAAEAAGMSGVYGLGNADGSLTDRLGAGAVASATGAVLGGAAAYGGSRFARALAARRAARAPAAATDGQATLAAMDRQGVRAFAPDVAGPTTRRATSVVAQTLGGAAPLRAAAQETLTTSQAVRDRVAATIATPVGVEETGEIARQGANRFMAETGQRIGRIYDQANQAAGRAVIDTPEANRILANELGPLEEAAVPSPGVAILQGLRDGLQTPTTVRGLRSTRTAIRAAFENAGLRGSNEERIANRAVDAATDDLVAGLRSQGLDTAARQYRVADRMWRERLATIDDNLSPILGDATGPRAKSGEQIVQGLTQAMQGNNRRFAGFMSALPPEEQAIVRSSVISRLGQAAAGQQDQTGEVFSLPTFLTQYNKIGGRARQVLFGQEGRAALDDLATIASGAREAQRYANFSNTGSVVGGLATGASLLGGPLTTAKFLALQYGAGRLLASPRFARWLARPPRQATPAATQAYVARLTRIARSEPAIAADVLNLQRRLTEAFGGSPARLAAEERDRRSAPVEGQQSQTAGPQNGLQP